jgi:hypothetical protein
MTQVLFTRNTITTQGKARIGDVLDLNDHEAKSLIGYGRCVIAGEEIQIDEQEADEQSIDLDGLQDNGFDTDELENTSVGLDSSDGEPVIRRGRPKKAK